MREERDEQSLSMASQVSGGREGRRWEGGREEGGKEGGRVGGRYREGETYHRLDFYSIVK